MIQCKFQAPHQPFPPPRTLLHPPPPIHSAELSRRHLALAAVPLLLATRSSAQAAQPASNAPCMDARQRAVDGKKAFLDVSIDGEPVGRITVGLYTAAAPVGSARFLSLVTGAAGVSYRRKEFTKIMQNYVQHSGVRSYGVDADLARSRGDGLDAGGLVGEWERERGSCAGVKNVRGSVGIVVRDPKKPPPKTKLVARKGRIEVDEEPLGTDPNGTEFVIVADDAGELDDSTLVVGRVVDGMEVVERIRKVRTVQENTASPYFRVAKLIGDKRAVVAERGFNRPYSKVVITNCGLLQ